MAIDATGLAEMRREIYRDLSETASGMSVSVLSTQYEDRANDEYIRDTQDGEHGDILPYVKDDGTYVVIRNGKPVTMRNGRPVKARREFVGNDDVAPGVFLVRGKGVDYLRAHGTTRAVSLFKVNGGYKALCRCGASDAYANVVLPFEGPLTFEDSSRAVMNAGKWALLHLAKHVANGE